MNINDIKKTLYREKPIAKIQEVQTDELKEHVLYTTKLLDGKHLAFTIPLEEYDSDKFGEEISAQLLIRWLVFDEKED